MEQNTQGKLCLGEWAGPKGRGQRARGPFAIENCRGRANGGGKLAVNALRQVAGGEVGAANGGSLKVPFWRARGQVHNCGAEITKGPVLFLRTHRVKPFGEHLAGKRMLI